MSGSRSKSGCWTCRVRRKKCDEATPVCSNCTSRGLHCHGYGERPAWMLSKDNWQQVLDSDDARDIRNGAERAYLRRRQKQLKEAPWATRVLVQDLARPASDLYRANAEVDRTWSNCRQLLRDCDFTPDYRHIQTFLDLIFPVQWGFFDLNQQQSDRRWLFDTIVASEPTYHASRGMCISFESGLMAGSTSGECHVTPEVRTSKHVALRGLQQYVTNLQQEGRLDITFLAKAVRAVAVILLLTSLELFGQTEGSWEVHQHAAGTVLDLIETQIAAADGTSSLDIGSIGSLLETSMPSFEVRALRFFVTTYVWADILAEATHGATYSRPRHFDYLPLLRRGCIDTRSIMGCQNSIMIAIKEVSNLAVSACQETLQSEPNERINSLALHVQELIREAASNFTPTAVGPEADSSWVTLLHAHATLIHLQTIVESRPEIRQLSVEKHMDECLRLLEALPSRLFIRVCWPFTVAGCMAAEAQYPRFRALVQRVEKSGYVLGFTWKGLIVMEECWQLRRRKPKSSWCCRTTMKDMGARILII